VADLQLLENLDGAAPISSDRFSASLRPFGTKLELATAGPVDLRLPGTANRVTGLGLWRALWLAPARWLLVHPAANQSTPPELLEAATSGLARIIDVTCRRSEIACEGPAVPEIFGKCTPLDLRPDRFAPGTCAQTWFSGFPVIVERRETDCSIFVEAPLSAAFWAMLTDAAS